VNAKSVVRLVEGGMREEAACGRRRHGKAASRDGQSPKPFCADDCGQGVASWRDVTALSSLPAKAPAL